MKIRYLTIEREYGSGGTAIARRVAREAGVCCYGAEILEAVAEKYGRSVADLESLEESAARSAAYPMFVLSRMNRADADMLTGEGRLYVAEQDAIRRFACGGPAVFLGHCAAQALTEQEGVARVFIRCTDEEEKRARILGEYGIPEAELDGTRRYFDRKRANYYEANTREKWDDFRNYDLVLDSAALGADTCVNILKACLAPERA